MVHRFIYVLFLVAIAALFSFQKIDSVGVSVPVKIQKAEQKLKIDPNNFSFIEELTELYLYQLEYEKAGKLIAAFFPKTKNNELLRAKCWLWKGEVYKFQNEIGKAYFCYATAKDIFKRKKHWTNMVLANGRLMEFYRKVYKHKNGLWIARQTEIIINKHHVTNPKILNLFYNRYAALLNEQAQAKQSLVYSQKALIYAHQLNDLNAEAISYNEMGFSYKNLNKVALSIQHYQMAESQWRLKGYVREAINAEFNIMMMYAHNNLIDLDEQIASFKAMMKKANAAKIYEYDVPILHYIRTSYQFKGDLENEYKYYRLGTERTNQLKEADRNIQLRDVEEKYANNQLNERLKNEKKQIADQLQKNIQNKRTIWVFAILTIIILSGLIYSVALQRKVKKSLSLIQQKDKQKNILISEIHHRVKNNLQYVRSMLEMQLSIVEDDKDKENLEDVSRRIHAMSLVHEMLYNNEDVIGINIADYFQRLFQHLSIGYASPNQPKLTLQIPAVELAITEVTSLGIVCAELFNNSVKYAYIDNDNPIFRLELNITDSAVQLKVMDNGFNQPPSNPIDENRQKLGMRIIDIFARQLKASYDIDRNNGYHFKLQYKRDNIQ